MTDKKFTPSKVASLTDYRNRQAQTQTGSDAQPPARKSLITPGWLALFYASDDKSALEQLALARLRDLYPTITDEDDKIALLKAMLFETDAVDLAQWAARELSGFYKPAAPFVTRLSLCAALYAAAEKNMFDAAQTREATDSFDTFFQPQLLDVLIDALRGDEIEETRTYETIARFAMHGLNTPARADIKIAALTALIDIDVLEGALKEQALQHLYAALLGRPHGDVFTDGVTWPVMGSDPRVRTH